MSRKLHIRSSHGYILTLQPGHPNANRQGRVYEHVLIASRVIGKPLPPGAQVHHVNEQHDDNRNRNLVVCQDNSYHKLIERRGQAYRATGHADWLWCTLCGTYGDPAKMWVSRRFRSVAHHRVCHARYQRERVRRLPRHPCRDCSTPVSHKGTRCHRCAATHHWRTTRKR